MMVSNPYEQYRQQGVMTASPMELTVMLYDGCIKQLKIGKTGIEGKDFELTNQALQKAQDIIGELANSLDMGVEMSQGLLDLYDFFLNQIIAANINKDAALIDPVVELMKELRDAWATAARSCRITSVSMGG